MKTGIELIVLEREEQFTKHNRSIDYVVKFNPKNQLTDAASKLCYPNIEDIHGIEDGEPDGWDNDLWNKMINKPYRERLIIAGALIAAEIDRLDRLNTN